MNIAVLMKQTFDTEERIVLTGDGVSEEGVKFVINPYDEYAVEQGILMRDAAGCGKVTVITVGPPRAAEALRTALAMGADEAVHIDDERIGGDEYAVSRVLAALLGGEGTGAPALNGESVDVLLGGNFSVDNGAGQVAVRVAALLGIPHVASVTKLEMDGTGRKATAHRDAEGDTEIVEVELPALFTAQQGLNDPRYPSLAGIMKAKRKPLRTLTLDDFGLTSEAVTPATTRLRVTLPPERAAGRMITGTPQEQVKELVRLLRDEGGITP
jgi:electron transfer flavoprotein beta subunit